MALTLAQYHQAQTCLIICPKSLVEAWKEKCDYDVISKENFKKTATKLPAYDCVIIDESHYFFGMQGIKKMSQMLKTLLWYLDHHRPRLLYTLTGTPYTSSPWSIYAAAMILGYKLDYRAFKFKFFQEVNMGMRWPIPVVRKGMEGEIAKIVQSIGDVVKMEDCFDVPEQIYQTEYFELTKQQKDAIDDLQDTNALSRWTKIHQIMGGTLKGDGYVDDQFFPNEKEKRLLELVGEHKLIAVVCRYNAEIDNLYQLIKQKYPGKFVRRITGHVPGNARHAICQDINKQDDGVVLINAMCSAGYEIPHIPLMIFYSLDFSSVHHTQVCGRIQRANHLKKNVYKYFIVKKSIDEDIYKCISKKLDFTISIYSKDQR